MGRKDERWPSTYQTVLAEMIAALQEIERFIEESGQNLLSKFKPKHRAITTPAELSKYLEPYF